MVLVYSETQLKKNHKRDERFKRKVIRLLSTLEYLPIKERTKRRLIKKILKLEAKKTPRS